MMEAYAFFIYIWISVVKLAILQQLKITKVMKKIFLSLAAVMLSLMASAQNQVTLKAGTIIPLQSNYQVKAADVKEGQTVDFSVIQDINVDGVCAIPRGTIVKGKVTEAKKSSLAGTKGRLAISINNLFLPNGEPLYFSNTDVRISGKNRTPLAVVLGLFVWPCIFIPGSKAAMPAGYEVQATVASNTIITTK